jgi:hypothetical protein
MPVPVAVPSKEHMILDHLNTRIVGSNPARGVNVCPVFFCVCVVFCESRGLATGRSLVQGILPKCLKKFMVSEVNSES